MTSVETSRPSRRWALWLRWQLVAHHAPAERRRLEMLFLLAQLAGLALPPPGDMDEGGVGRVHQAEGGMVRVAGKVGGDRDLWGNDPPSRAPRAPAAGRRIPARRRRAAGRRERRPRRCPGPLGRGSWRPGCARTAGLGLAPARGSRCSARRSRNASRGSCRRPPCRRSRRSVQRNAPVRADVAQGEDRAVGGPADQQRLPEQPLGGHAARLQGRTGQGQVPEVLEQRGAAVEHGALLGRAA